MTKFHEISTEKYLPLSHDTGYLYDHYDKVHNFIKVRLPEFKNILAKQISVNHNVEWFSVFENLQFENPDFQKFELQEYWSFKDKLEKEIETFGTSKDSDTENWIAMLRNIFNHEDNLLWSNGKELTIIWGWKFENLSNHRHLLANIIKEEKELENDNGENDDPGNEGEKIIIPEPDPIIKDDENIDTEAEEVEEDVEQIPLDPVIEKTSFLEFLKEFAAKYWWLLVVLLALISFVYFF